MRERELPPVRPVKGAGALRLTRDPRGRPLLLVPEGLGEEIPRAFLRGWRRGESLTPGAPDAPGLLGRAALWGADYARRLGVSAPEVALTGGSRVWGLCDPARGLIRLHADLSRMPEGVAREVLLHEVCHLREPEHSPAFWGLMGELMPDWAEWEGVLRCLARKR